MKTDIRHSSYMALPGLKPGIRFFGTIEAKDIIECVSNFTGVHIDDMKSMSRRRENVEARHIAMYIIRNHTNLSLPSIARMFGGRDHTSAMHGIKQVKDLCFSDHEFKQRVFSIENDLQYY